MAAQAAQPAPVIRFSTEDLPDHGRLSALRDYINETMRFEMSSLDSEMPLQFALVMRAVPGVAWGTVTTSAIATKRTAQLVKDGCDDLFLGIPDARMAIEVPGADALIVRPGDAILLSQAREIHTFLPEAANVWTVRVPHRAIAQIAPRLGSAPVAVFRQGTPMLSLLQGYGELLEADPLTGEATQQLAARHLLEMTALIIGSSADLLEEAEATTLAAARLRMAKAEIDARLGNTNLSLEWVAGRQKVTPRHLQRLFAREGTNFTDVLRRARTAKARAMLEDTGNVGRSILSIALECGFPEASALNRAFRGEYGLTPGEVRPKARNVREL